MQDLSKIDEGTKEKLNTSHYINHTLQDRRLYIIKSGLINMINRIIKIDVCASVSPPFKPRERRQATPYTQLTVTFNYTKNKSIRPHTTLPPTLVYVQHNILDTSLFYLQYILAETYVVYNFRRTLKKKSLLHKLPSSKLDSFLFFSFLLFFLRGLVVLSTNYVLYTFGFSRLA